MISKQKNNPLVSVIMPSYNREESLGNAINSIIKQTYSNWELIIVDDCSTDETSGLVQKFLNEDSRIKFIRLKENSGACTARNVGIENSKGEFITFLDSDDEYLPKKIEKQLDLFKKAQIDNLGVVSCGRVDCQDGVIYQKTLPQKKRDYYKSLLSKESRIGAGTPFLMVKAYIIKEEGILFDPQMPAMQDWDFLIRICRNYEFTFVPDYLVKVNHHSSERVYNSQNAVKAIKLQYKKYHGWLLEDLESYSKFIKNGGLLIAHHDSVKNAIKFIEKAKKDFGALKKIKLDSLQIMLRFFKFNYFKLFYLKFFR